MKRLALALGALLVATATTAVADSGGLGLGAGFTRLKDGGESHLWLTASMRTMLGNNFALEPEIGWYRDNRIISDEIGPHLDAFNLGGSALAIAPLRPVDLYVGAGIGLHYFRFAESFGNETHFAYHGLAGVDLKVSHALCVFGAVRYEVVTGNEWGNTEQWKVYGGLRFRMH